MTGPNHTSVALAFRGFEIDPSRFEKLLGVHASDQFHAAIQCACVIALACILLVIPAWVAAAATPIDVRLRQEDDGLRVVVANNSADVIRVRGSGGFGLPPGLDSIQWEVSIAGKKIHHCVLTSAGPRIERIMSGKSREFRMPTSAIERVFCLSSGVYEVRAAYTSGDTATYSNSVRVVAPPKGK